MRPSILAGLLAAAFPVPANAEAIIIGDSRCATNSENASEIPYRTTASTGWVSWMQARCGYRLKFTGNYGVGGDKLIDIQTRLNGGSARGNILTAGPGLTARIAFFLAGVNNVNDAASITSPLYDNILSRVIDAGYTVFILTEIPNSNQSGAGAVHYARHEYLANWPAGAVTAFTPEKRALYTAKRVLFNSYDLFANPADPYYPLPGYYIDLLHLNGLGGRRLGENLGDQVEIVLSAAGMPVRNTLPLTASGYVTTRADMLGSTAITATNNEAATNGNQNKDGQDGRCITGVVPTGWTATRGTSLRLLLNGVQPVVGSQLSMVCSKIVDPDGYEGVQLRITGQVGAQGTVYGIGINNIQTFTATTILTTGLADGDVCYSIGRVRIPAGSALGLLGFSPELNVSSAQFPNAAGTLGAMSGNLSSWAQRLDGMAAVDYTIMSQPITVPVGFIAFAEASKQIQCSLSVAISGGTPIDITLLISRLGVVKNR